MDVINNDEFTVGSSNTSKGKKLAIKKKLSSHSKASLASAKSKTSGSGTFLSTQPAPMAIDKSYLGDEDNDEQFERYPLDYSGRGIPVADNTTGIKRRVAAVLAAAASSSMDIDSPFSDEEDDSAILIDPSSITSSNRPTPVTRLPAAQVQAMSTLLSFPAVSHTSTSGLTQRRKVSIPPHRMTPLKRDWVKIYGPLVEELGLQVRMNLGRKWVELKTSKHTPTASSLTRASDFLAAYALGFTAEDAIALLRLEELYVESFEIKDVKMTLHGDHLSRAIGRIAGHEGKTRFVIENASRTRIVLADTKIHILGTFSNIKIARDAICALILGSPPGKIYAGLRQVAARSRERF